MAKQTNPRLVKEVPNGYVKEIRDGKTVFVKKTETPNAIIPDKVKPKPRVPSANKPSLNVPPKPRPKVTPPTVSEDVVYLEEPVVEPVQKVQSLRKDLTEEFPNGLESGYRSFRVPDLNTGGNYAKQKNVITDKDGMPVIYDFKQNKYIQTGEPNIHLNMPVQNDTPTIQDALKPNELPTKFDVVPERLRAPNYNKAKLTTPIVDTSVYKGFNEVGNTNNTLNDIEFKKEQDKNLAIPKLKNGGGISAKVKGYYNGGNVDVFGNPTTSQSVGTTASGNPNSQNNDFTPTGDSNKSKGFYDAFNYDKSANKGVISQSDAYGVAAANAKQKPSYTTTSGVVGITDAYSDAKKEQDQKSREVAAAKKDALTASSMAAAGNVQKRSTNVETATNLGVAAAGIASNYLDDAGKDDRGRYKNVESAVASKYLKGTAIGAQYGSIIGPWGTLIGAGIGGTAGVIQGAIVGDRDVKAIKASDKKREDELKRANDEVMSNQAILARNNGEFDFVKSSPYTSNNAMYDDNDNLIRMNKGGIVSKIKGYSDGGQIKGKGTGKSDSILAKVKAGSFIVPAENAEAAEELREKFLGKPPKSKANLNEKGGETVKLSNGEHKFTPEEKHELLEKGVNVDALAPDSKVKAVEKKSHIMFPNVIGLKNGGEPPVKQDKTYVKPPKVYSKADLEYMKKVNESKVAREKILADELAKGNTVMAIPGGDYQGDSTYVYPNEAKGSSVGRHYVRTQLGARLEGVNHYDEKALWMNNPNIKLRQDSTEYNALGYATGGDVVEEDTVDPIKELARLNKEKEDAVKAGKVESDAAKAARDKKIADFNAKVASYDRKADRKNKASEWEKKRNDSKTKLDALNKSYEDASKSFEAANTPTAAQKAKGIKAGALNDTQRKYQEDLLKKIQEAKSEFDNADRTYNYVKDDNNYDASGNIKVKPKTATVIPKTEVKPSVVAENVATAKPSLRVPKSNKIVVADNLPSKDIALTELKNDAELRANAAAIDQEKSIANAPTRQAVINDANKANNDAYVSSNPTQRKGGIMDKIGSIDPTSLIGIGQMYVGKNMLSDSKRPVDKAVIDPTYNANVDRALKEASFGLTPEQKFMAQQDIENNKRDSMRLGVNYAGGSGTQAFNLNRASINDAWKAKLGLGIADQEARMAKQKYADAMAADRAGILASNRRQAYNDAMGTFNQTQAAGSELIGAGLQNTIGAYRYNKMMKQQDEIDAASNPWLNYKA